MDLLRELIDLRMIHESKVPDEIMQWIKSVCMPPKKNTAWPEPDTTINEEWWSYYDGKLNYRAKEGDGKSLINMVCTEIKYPMGYFNGSLYINPSAQTPEDERLKSLKNLPKTITRALVLNTSVEQIDQPIFCARLRVFGGLKSLKNIHKFVVCQEICVDDNPIEGSILDLLKIKDLHTIDTSAADDDLSKAMSILDKYVGHGSSGIIKAQRDLIENDLEDYA